MLLSELNLLLRLSQIWPGAAIRCISTMSLGIKVPEQPRHPQSVLWDKTQGDREAMELCGLLLDDLQPHSVLTATAPHVQLCETPGREGGDPGTSWACGEAVSSLGP